MTNSPYILFNKSIEQLRHLGARGGKAHARNRRARRALQPNLPQPVQLVSPRRETVAEAIAVLDIQFPWLRGAERPSRLTPNVKAAAPRTGPPEGLPPMLRRTCCGTSIATPCLRCVPSARSVNTRNCSRWNGCH
jgi:hypothetical protein